MDHKKGNTSEPMGSFSLLKRLRVLKETELKHRVFLGIFCLRYIEGSTEKGRSQ